ncbi:MAG: NosD domain-containing protein [Methanomicrobiaceae archaeon]|nr:NosD domain-containing protein [Methanomicrobiaceae archaeon]
MKPIHVLLVMVALASLAMPALAATLVVAESGGDHADLQAAVDAAGSGDAIEVRSGTYPGRVTVGKPLSITGSGDNCRIGTAKDEYGLLVTAEGVTLRNLGLAGSDVAVSLNNAHSAAIESCRVERGERGILLVDSRAVTVTDSDISADFIGIEASNTSQIRISGTRIAGATQGIVLYQAENAALRDNRIEDCTIGLFIHESAGGVLENTALSRLRGGVALLMAVDWTIRGSTLEAVDQYLDACMSSGCRIEAGSLDGPDPFVSDAISANRYDIGMLSVEGRDFSLSADATPAPEGYVRYGECFRLAFIDVASTAGSMVRVDAGIEHLDLNGTEPGTLGIYRVDGPVTQVPGLEAGNSTVAAVILEPGSYALAAKVEGSDGLLIWAAFIVLIAVALASAILYFKAQR